MMGWNLLKRTGRTVRALGDMDVDLATDVNVTYVQRSNAAATSGRHYPSPEGGVLEVLPWSHSEPDRIIQRYTGWTNLTVHLRRRFNGAWSEWKKVGT